MTRISPFAAALLLAGTLPLHAQQSETGTPQDPPVEVPQSDTGTENATRPEAESAPPSEDVAQEDVAREDVARIVREVGTDWPYWGGDADATRYSPLDQITRDNVARLEQVFSFHTGDLPEGTAVGKYSPEVTPLKIGDDLLMCSAMNILISVDAATGEENWRFDPGVPNEAIPYGATCRGVSVYTNPQAAEGDACATRVIQGTLDAKLVAVDLETGAPCEDFGENGTVDLWQDIGERVPGWYAVTAPPAIVRGIVVTGAQVKDGQADSHAGGRISTL